ncbi:lamina-associated polypeptide 2, isoforms beta/delta/epsilon/gamma-like isoform X2 [Phyllopteryx taeniolatus]|uniref:lamina-associated polypeptide 2, isoforms beta/delta/epsilon/gamma-like isoform X2 n=1 Tax=Phyllopteryx taeniolatus TaxID=161469 RepID=UPI002AD52462|nr:lamina-associated polypeptide 2, isoforms beta/delta/epsilon/gamma-like isoform X2 [Phyllopteryx taeniolatus]
MSSNGCNPGVPSPRPPSRRTVVAARFTVSRIKSRPSISAVRPPCGHKRLHRATVSQEEKPEDGEKANQKMPPDDELRAALLAYGVKAGPIVGSTRAVYERKLMRLRAADGAQSRAVASEDRDDEGDEDAESGPEQEDEESDERGSGRNGHVYQRCFLPSSRLRFGTRASRRAELCRKPAVEKVSKWSTRSGGAVQILDETSGASIVDQHSKVSSRSIQDSQCSSEKFSIAEMVEKMEKQMSPAADSQRNERDGREPRTQSDRADTTSAADERQSRYSTPKESLSNVETKAPTKDDLPSNIQPSCTVFNATCRRPIKGAAGRPVVLKDPKPPVSPATLERREMERQMVPVQLQVAVFVVIALLLFAIVESEPLTPLLALMNHFMRGFIDDADGRTDGRTPTFSGHE